MNRDSNIHLLPEPVIHKIFSLLSSQDAIRASASSKLWRSAWISFPIFSFDEATSPFKNSDFFDHVDRSLALWCHRCDNSINMEKLSLSAAISNAHSFSGLLNVVAVATGRNVKAVELTNCDEYFWTMTESDSLWPLLSACESLGDLSLELFRIFFLNSLAETSSLKKLKLAFTRIDNNSFRNLLASFPLLENLDIHRCFGFTELYISLPNLVKLKMFNYENLPPKVVIEAPNLQSFSYIRSFNSAGGIVFSTTMKSLTSLRIDRCHFVSVSSIDELIAQIPNLEDLALESSKFLDGTRISHSNLKILKLHWCKGFTELEIDTPSLSFFCYYGRIVQFSTFRYCSGILNAQLIMGSPDTEWFWFIKLRNFLECLRDCRAVKLRGYLEGFSEQLKNDNFLPDPFSEMRHLDISNRTLRITDFSCFVYAMLELFPCLETLFLKTSIADIVIEVDKNGSVSLKWRKFLNVDGDTSKSIDDAMDEIMENNFRLDCGLAASQITRDMLELRAEMLLCLADLLVSPISNLNFEGGEI
ncbi:hypothetical protein TIFTF001_025384 [Ficus carica]|uniref:F-box domain-containing protein n=1 Tax=Ficus carica TaxID=3494 RepID=A0AA88AYS8_FICCA|nr:hypothetical protein TIFTF001_025384 [Ficus carica]